MKYFSIYFLVLTSACHLNRGDNGKTSISTLPNFTIQLLDSTTISAEKNIPVGKPIIIMYFRPDCPHCQKETRIFTENIGVLKGVNFYMVCNASIPAIKKYSSLFNLQQYENITIGRDIDHNVANIFQPSSVPYMAIYSTRKDLIKVYYGEVDIKNVITAIHS